MYAHFLLGELQVTEKASAKLKRLPLDLIARHAVNDHGLVTVRVLRQNALNMKRVGEIKSCYHVDPTDPTQGRVVVVTDDTWSTTTVKLESEQ